MDRLHWVATMLFASAVFLAPAVAAAAGGGAGANPTMGGESKPQSAPQSTNKAKTKKKPPNTNDKSSSAGDFIAGYHAAYALIYDDADYAGGIAALRALNHDNNPDVANLLGYASRKLGRYDDAKFWYERALAVDPNHALTWSYYGMWQAEQGNVLKAQDDLEKVRLICGTDCRPYQLLKEVIDGIATY